ncbi:MAG: hypothetical protein OHK0028_14990 [Deltaproteobacteria bacterium]
MAEEPDPAFEPSQIEIVPKSWFSWDYDLYERGALLATIDNAWWRELGAFEHGGKRYTVRRDGLTGPFLLEGEEGEIARAVKPGFAFRRFEVEYAGRRFSLHSVSSLRNSFELAEGDRPAGSVRCSGRLSYRGQAFLPPDLPPPVRVFLVWLVVLLWRRRAEGG